MFLTRYSTDPAINSLRGKQCLYLKGPEGDERYFSPNQVFWEQHSFGKYRFRLSADYGRFKILFDQIGVKEDPDVSDAISVIQEISNEYEVNKFLLKDSPDVEDILIMCWKLVSKSLEKETISRNEIKRKLKNQKSIPNIKKILIKPELIFFEDRPGWGEKFNGVKEYLTPRIESAWQGMEAAGVRPLSAVVNTEMIICENRTENNDLLKIYLERKNLVQRVVEEHRKQGVKDLSISDVESLTFYTAEKIEIIRTFTGFSRPNPSAPETVDAILFNGSLYFSKLDGNYPWKGVARELSYAINATGEIRSLSMELKEILSQSLNEATLTLNELGYPMVEIVETKIGEGQILEPGESEGEIEGIRVSVDIPEAGKQGQPIPSGKGKGQETRGESKEGQGISGQPQVIPSNESKEEKRKSSRLRSYVYPEGTLTTAHENPQSFEKRSAVAEKGVERVMQFERENGRIPKDMEKVQVHHPGYDIESKEKSGAMRFIEVKSLSDLWDMQNPAELTKFEFETAKKNGESYWLYVVERADSEDFQIFTIQNPANRVDYYLFDHGWIPQK